MKKLFGFIAILLTLELHAEVNPEALKLWKKRDEAESLKSALALFEKSEDLESLTYLARGYYTLAEHHTTDDGEKKATYEKAKSFGEKALNTNPEYKKLVSENITKAIDSLTAKEAPALFWTAAAIGKWAKLNGIMSSLGYKGQILSMIEKVEKLQPDYFHGAVPRYWGGFYAVAPRIAGGNMGKSKKNFKKAIEMAPEYLGSRVLYAELYWAKEDEKKDFKKELELVLASSEGPEEIAPDNRLEKKKAQRLLDNIEKIFD